MVSKSNCLDFSVSLNNLLRGADYCVLPGFAGACSGFAWAFGGFAGACSEFAGACGEFAGACGEFAGACGGISVAGPHFLPYLRRFLLPVADLCRRSALFCRPATLCLRTCDASSRPAGIHRHPEHSLIHSFVILSGHSVILSVSEGSDSRHLLYQSEREYPKQNKSLNNNKI